MNSSGFAFFDVDHTLIAGSTGKYLAIRCVQEGLLSFRHLLKIPLLYFHYRTGRLEPEILKGLLHQLRGLPIQHIRDMSAEIFLEKIRPRLYTRAIRQMEKEQAKGRRVVLATSAPLSIVTPLAEYLEIEDVIATIFEVQDGVLTGSFEGIPAFGEGKQKRVGMFAADHGVDLACCSFYSDSHYDMPLLKRVKEPVAVNPDRALRSSARRMGWKVLYFKEVIGKNGDTQYGTLHSGD